MCVQYSVTLKNLIKIIIQAVTRTVLVYFDYKGYRMELYPIRERVIGEMWVRRIYLRLRRIECE